MALSSPVLKKINDSEEEFIENNRYKKFEDYLKFKDFDTFMLRLTYEHGNDYIEKCLNNGYTPTPNNKLNFIIQYLKDNYADIIVRKIKTDELNKTWSFKGYYFQIIEDSKIKVYNKDDLTLMISL